MDSDGTSTSPGKGKSLGDQSRERISSVPEIGLEEPTHVEGLQPQSKESSHFYSTHIFKREVILVLNF